ncbi:MAG TPA: hypothetical protein VF171_06540 [Trueperaceae bacterium]
MPHYICVTCGSQFGASEAPPAHCPICEDERQYVGHDGQLWTTLAELGGNHRNRVELLEPALTGIGTEPEFAIGQRALLVQTSEGNVLWDCISLLDEATRAAVERLGGLSAIAISHPHFYSSMIEWAHAFDAPVYLHAADRQWVMRPDPAIRFWVGETQQLFGGLTLVRGGGHFEGGTVLHWPQGAGGRGALLCGDIISPAADRRYVSFMYSYPNRIPLPAAEVRRIAATMEPYAFDRIYGGWWGQVVSTAGKEALRLSAERYVRALAGILPPGGPPA